MSAIHGHLARKRFDAVPPPMRLGRRLAWLAESVDGWIDDKAAQAVVQAEEYRTVIRQHAEDVRQTAQQIRMVQQNIEQYQNMLQNTKNLSPDMLSGLSGEFRKLSGLQRQMRLQRGDAQALSRELQDLEDAEFDRKVQELLNTPEGRMEAMQAANQLTALQLREAREMRSLMNTYIQAQIQAASKAEQDAQAQREADRRLMNMDSIKNADSVKGMADPF
ncbi:MAG: hypothetical protein LBR94_01365 [Desulfovibrio sp.]|nr:hypothetical protein [Desulfovibrio sp.]